MTKTNTRLRGKLDFDGALHRLRALQPDAYAIRRLTCHCPTKALMLSYRVPISGDDPGWLAREKSLAAQNEQTCGFFCATCGFTNAGSREAVSLLGDDAP